MNREKIKKPPKQIPPKKTQKNKTPNKQSQLQERDSNKTFEATEVEGSTGFSDKVLLQSSNHSLSLSSEFDYNA